MAKAPEIDPTLELPAVELVEREGHGTEFWLTRGGVSGAAIGAFALFTALTGDNVLLRHLADIFIFAIAALSMNLLMGYAGQISLGHQAFIGLGAFVSAGLVGAQELNFWVGILGAVAVGAVAAGMLGVVALRLKGLYLALITLAFGVFTEHVIFGIRSFTGGAAGRTAPKPAGFSSEFSYLWLCIGVFAVVAFLDWRLVTSKAGRALRAIRDDESVASSLGVNVTFYKIFAFVLSGALAGLAGGLLAHEVQFVSAEPYNFQLALTVVFIAVVGGLGSRMGVFVAAAFFTLLEAFPDRYGWFDPTWTPFIGAMLLVVTLVLHPGGVADLLRPITEWYEGKPFRLSAIRHRGGGSHGPGPAATPHPHEEPSGEAELPPEDLLEE